MGSSSEPRIGVVVHAQIEILVGIAAVAAFGFGDPQRRRLPAALIAACRVSGLKRRHQPVGQFAL